MKYKCKFHEVEFIKQRDQYIHVHGFVSVDYTYSIRVIRLQDERIFQIRYRHPHTILVRRFHVPLVVW